MFFCIAISQRLAKLRQKVNFALKPKVIMKKFERKLLTLVYLIQSDLHGKQEAKHKTVKKTLKLTKETSLHFTLKRNNLVSLKEEGLEGLLTILFKEHKVVLIII